MTSLRLSLSLRPFADVSSTVVLALACALPFAAAQSSAPGANDPVQLDPVVTTIGRGDSPLRITTDPKAPAQPAPAHDGADVLKSTPGSMVPGFVQTTRVNEPGRFLWLKLDVSL